MASETCEALTAVCTDVLERMTFAFAERVPTAEAAPDDGQLLKCTIWFDGPMMGQIEMIAAAAMGAELAANMLGLDPSEIQPEQARDALCELLNVVCGQLLTHMAGTEPVFRLHPPEAESASEQDWAQRLADEDVVAMSVDDYQVLLRVQLGHSEARV